MSPIRYVASHMPNGLQWTWRIAVEDTQGRRHGGFRLLKLRGEGWILLPHGDYIGSSTCHKTMIPVPSIKAGLATMALLDSLGGQS